MNAFHVLMLDFIINILLMYLDLIELYRRPPVHYLNVTNRLELEINLCPTIPFFC